MGTKSSCISRELPDSWSASHDTHFHSIRWYILIATVLVSRGSHSVTLFSVN